MELEAHWDERCPGWDWEDEERASLSDGTRRQRAWVGISVDTLPCPQDRDRQAKLRALRAMRYPACSEAEESAGEGAGGLSFLYQGIVAIRVIHKDVVGHSPLISIPWLFLGGRSGGAWGE